MIFASPLTPIVLFVLALLGARNLRQNNKRYMSVPSLSELSHISSSYRVKLRGPILWVCSLFGILSLLLATGRPQRIEPLPQEQFARNVVVALDLSRSMEAEDFTVRGRDYSRIEGVKNVFEDLLSARPTDRIGIVVFGQRAFLQSPLTQDHEILREMVASLSTGLAGDGTAIGDGLGLSIKRVREVTADSRAIILITDGVNNSGEVNPQKAAQVAKDLEISVHTIGIGRVTKNGEYEFDEKLLRDIANITGGLYASADNADELRSVYQKIEALETSKSDSNRGVEVTEYYPHLLVIGTTLLAMVFALRRSYFLVLPR